MPRRHFFHSIAALAGACALICSWWSWYRWAAYRRQLMVAITSPPLLLAAVGQAVCPANQTILYLQPLHGTLDALKNMIWCGFHSTVSETLCRPSRGCARRRMAAWGRP